MTYSRPDIWVRHFNVTALQPFDDGSLANVVGIRPKLLWYAIVVEDRKKYSQFQIPKKQGGVRVIHAPNPSMRYVLRALNKYLDQFQEDLPEYVAAYRKEHQIKTAVARHIPHCEICEEGGPSQKHKCPRKGAYLQMDLKDFFHRTQASWIRKCMRDDLGMEKYVAGLIAGMTTVRDIPNPSKLRPDRLRKGVPQGAPTSGTICNLVAYYRLDLKLIAYLEKLDERYGLRDKFRWVYTRYADDLAFTCGRDFSMTEKIQFIQDIAKIIQTAGYAVNSKKTRIKNPHKRKELLGVVFNQRVTLARDKYLILRAIVHNCLTLGIETQHVRAGFRTPERFICWLRGKVAHVKHLDSSKGSALSAELTVSIKNYRTYTRTEIFYIIDTPPAPLWRWDWCTPI
jgi:hypothetical protein